MPQVCPRNFRELFLSIPSSYVMFMYLRVFSLDLSSDHERDRQELVCRPVASVPVNLSVLISQSGRFYVRKEPRFVHLRATRGGVH